MIYEILHLPRFPELGVSYDAHRVYEGQQIVFKFKDNLLVGNVVGCGSNLLLVQVEIYD